LAVLLEQRVRAELRIEVRVQEQVGVNRPALWFHAQRASVGGSGSRRLDDVLGALGEQLLPARFAGDEAQVARQPAAQQAVSTHLARLELERLQQAQLGSRLLPEIPEHLRELAAAFHARAER